MSTPDEPTPGNDEAPRRTESEAAARVRFLAQHGLLAQRARAATPEEYTHLHRGVYEICWPVVFDGLTRRIERSRGHATCALGLPHLEAECLDRFHDDVEAVVVHVLDRARTPIHTLEGWIRRALVAATADGNRRRRGERGAPQRPRLPQWLSRLLAGDPWLRALAIDIMTWVGVPTTAGTELWPYTAWAERRVALTGDTRSTEHDVARDIETVLRLMRSNSRWYERSIEQPLGHKQAPIVAGEDTMQTRYLALDDGTDGTDAWLHALATVAIDVIDVRIREGERPQSVVVEVVSTVFGSALPPLGHAPDDRADERVAALLADQATVDRLVRLVCEILGITY